MLTHDAVLWQYVSCLVDAGIAADDLALHALPLYHCAQLDVFLGPSIYCGATNIITATPTPDNLLPLIAQAPHHQLLRAADGVDLAAALAAVRQHRPVQPAQGLLRRVDHAGGGAARDRCSGCPSVRLWNLYGQTEIAPLATMLGPEDQLRKPGSCGRAVLNVRDARGRRRDARRHARRGRRDRAPLAAPDAGLLPRRRAHGRGLRGRLVPQRRPGAPSTTRATSRWSTARRT